MKQFGHKVPRLAAFAIWGTFCLSAFVFVGGQPAAADRFTRTLHGAVGGAIIGGIVGGRSGAGTGAIVGGTIGFVSGAIDDDRRYRRRRVHRQRRRVHAPRAVASSPLVYETQSTLTRLGYNPGPADGVYGGRTSIAIKAYQNDNGLLVTGQPSQALLDHMRKGAGS